MNRRVVVFLAIAAVAVAIQNFVFFSASSPPVVPGEADGEPAAEANAAAAPVAMGPVCADALSAFLAALPDLERARNSFLTRAEAMALADAAPAEGLESLVLDGTLVNAERRVAWLDGIPTSEGGWVGDHELLRVEPGAVLLKKGDAQLRIELRKPAKEVLQP